MNPTVARGGANFRGAYLYYMHDRGKSTRERIAWTHTVNMATDSPDSAWKIMTFTARNQERLKMASGQNMSGRKAEKPVMAYSLSWHPEQDPTPDHMRETALQSLKVLGMEDYQAIVIAHSDTAHKHVHVIVNRIHPITGKVASSSFTYRKLSDFALEYGQAQGLTYSPRRAENKRMRQEGKQTRYSEPGIAEAWKASDSGPSFVAALKERGYELARGNKRLVVVDPYGKIHNPTRHIDGARAKDLQARLAGVNLAALPDADEVAKTKSAQHEQRKAANRPDTAKTEPPQANPDVEPTEQPKSAPVEPKPASDTPSKREASKPSPEHSDELEATRLNFIQDRQIEERASLSDSYHRRIELEKETMERYYRLKEQDQTIRKLREKCEKTSLWRRVFGLAKRDRVELETAQINYANSLRRYFERVRAVETEAASAIGKLRVQHQTEWKEALEPRVVAHPSRTKAFHFENRFDGPSESGPELSF